MRVAVIGGGITGLAVAHDLGRHGVEVDLYEASSRLGGLAAGFEVVPGRPLEHFYHHLFSTDTALLDLAESVGVADAIGWHPASIGWFIDGRIHRFDSPIDVFRLPISLWDRVGLARTMLELQRRTTARGMDVGVAEWFSRRRASGVYRHLWHPMLQAKWGDDADHPSAGWLWQKVRARGRSRRGFKEQLGYPSGGFGTIIEALQAALDPGCVKVHLRTPVDSLHTDGDRVVGAMVAGHLRTYDTVISTLPIPRLQRLVDGVPSVRYRGVVCHILVMDRPLTDIYWLNVADRSVPLGGIVEHTNFVDGYHGKHIAYLFAYLDADAPELSMAPDDFIEHHYPHVQRIVPSFRPGQVVDRFVFRTPTATPLYPHPFQPPPVEPRRGLLLADTSRIHPMDRGTSECVRLANYVSALARGVEARPPEPI